MSGLEGQVVAIIGPASAATRAIAIACGEAGADIALGTVDRSQEQEFGLNSIANELWSIGREQFVRVMDAAGAVAVTAFADEVFDRMGRCDALICAHHQPSDVPVDELGPGEWEQVLRANLTAPFLAAQAFGRLFERERHGRVLFIENEGETGDASYRAARSGLAGLIAGLNDAWRERGVRAEVVAAPDVVAKLSSATGE